MKTVTQTIILIIFTVFGLTSCDNTKQTSTEQPFTTADTTLKVTTNQEIKTTANQEIRQDTIQYDNVFYPEVHFPEWQKYYYDTNFVKQLLRTGEFHSDVIWRGAEEVKWFGLFKNESGFYLRDTKIRIHPVYEGNGCCYCDGAKYLLQFLAQCFKA